MLWLIWQLCSPDWLYQPAAELCVLFLLMLLCNVTDYAMSTIMQCHLLCNVTYYTMSPIMVPCYSANPGPADLPEAEVPKDTDSVRSASPIADESVEGRSISPPLTQVKRPVSPEAVHRSSSPFSSTLVPLPTLANIKVGCYCLTIPRDTV